ncbi:MAG TPA: SpoIIE family protein phosphatase [Acidimicrobiales bacterium]|nr:SpoIIE family protein phosphatase [Acidimicrobiales bacterium]
MSDVEAFYGALVEDDAEELYDNAPCAYLSTLPDGTIVKVNQTFLAWTGFERQALVGRRRFQDLLAPGDRIFYETHFGPALRMQGQVREIAVEIVTGDGSRLPVLVNAVLKHDAAGLPVAIRTAVFDATERRAYERELLQARRRAEESESRATALARTLQATFLPPALVEVPGLDLAGGYRPSGDGSEVGGDFYDAFAIDASSWGLVLGDVCGKGAAAAVVTSLVRYTVRAEAPRTTQPSQVLSRLHDVLVRNHPDQFCTAVFLRVERSAEGSFRVTVSAGGHPLPIRARRGQRGLDTVGAPGSMLGMLEHADVSDASTELMVGDVLVLYTDGITEARRDGEFFGEARVRAVVSDAGHATAKDLANALVAAAVEFQEGQTRDDIAVLVLRVT